MAMAGREPGPMVRGGTCLKGYQARLLFCQKFSKLGSGEFSVIEFFVVAGYDRSLDNILGEIYADGV